MHLSQIHNPSHPPTNHCGLIIHIPSLSSPLLLRNYPNTFAFIPLVVICLSSLNRSNSKAFCPILPCIAPVCESMHYHKTGVPWQTNKIFFIAKFHFPKSIIYGSVWHPAQYNTFFPTLQNAERLL